jgi:type I restriction enzyme M protein
VHNGSSLFTGDAGGGESNIRRYIIENDLLDTIIQLPNNLFYNTGITTYIWLLSNAKPAERQGKVQLIDGSLLFEKRRKNLGEKNCDLSPPNIKEITKAYLAFLPIERQVDANNDPVGIASQIFDGSDFGYYKVTIERPDRRKAQFSAERLAALRFDKGLIGPMQHLYETHGDAIYEPATLKAEAKAIVEWCEDNEITLNAKNRAKLLDPKYWLQLRNVHAAGHKLMASIGTDEYRDFNLFQDKVDAALKADRIKLAAAERTAILNSVSWYDETAEVVIKKTVKLSGDKLAKLLEDLGCEEADLADFGYYKTGKGEYLTYESSTDLRDSESVPLKDSIHRYYQAEVKPHVAEAWIAMDSVKIGYEISFNKYFYRHKPLRALEDVAADILALERQADGLIADIFGMKTMPELLGA